MLFRSIETGYFIEKLDLIDRPTCIVRSPQQLFFLNITLSCNFCYICVGF